MFVRELNYINISINKLTSHCRKVLNTWPVTYQPMLVSQ